MARTQRRDVVGKTSDLHKLLEAKTDELNEKLDCSIRALAIVTGISYKQARAALTGLGRKSRRRTPNRLLLNAVTDQGYTVTEVSQWDEIIWLYPGKHQLKRRVTSHQPDRFPEAWKNGKTYLMFCRGHVLAIVDGVNHDWTRGRSLRCTMLFEIKK